jgi:hypothetical protein
MELFCSVRCYELNRVLIIQTFQYKQRDTLLYGAFDYYSLFYMGVNLVSYIKER